MEKIVLGDDPDVKGGVYKITIGRWFYYGRTCNFRLRRNTHLLKLRKNEHRNQILQNAYNKHGIESVEFEPLVWCGPEDAKSLEASFIMATHSHRCCANLLIENGETFTHCEATKKKIGDLHRGKVLSDWHREFLRRTNTGRKRSQETCRKISAAKRGKTHSEATRKRMSLAQKQRFANTPVSEETRQKLARTWRGRKHTKETLAKMSESAKRRHVEKPFTPEVKEKMAEYARVGHIGAMRVVKKPVLVTTPGFESLFFLSGVDAERSLGLPKGKLTDWIRGARPIPKRLAGYHFSYIDKSRENWSAFPTACTHEHYGSTAP